MHTLNENTEMRQRKIVHVELKCPPEGYKRHYYFGSVAAIYDVLPRDVVGLAKGTLWNSLHGGSYEGRLAIVRTGALVAKAQRLTAGKSVSDKRIQRKKTKK